MSDLLNWILENQDSFRKNRLPSLFSDFAIYKQTNPDGYQANVGAWQKALSQAALAGKLNTTSSNSKGRSKITADGENSGTPGYGSVVVLKTSDQLSSELETREYGRPIALQCVIDEAVNSNALIPLDYFLTTQTSPFKKSWLPSISLPQPPSVGQVMGWGVRTLKGLIVGSSDDDKLLGRVRQGQYVIVDNLKAVAEHILLAAKDDTAPSADRVYSKESFAKEHCTWNDIQLSEPDVDVLLTYLSRDEQKIAYDGKTLKILTPNETPTITQEDTTIASLKSTISELNTHITRLETQISTLTSQIQSSLASKNRVSAASALKKRKLAEHNLQIRTNTLFQLEDVYMKIQQARDQIGIVNVMQESTKALRGLTEKVGGVDTVQDIVDELRSEMDAVDDVGQMISETGGASAAEIDEGEIDEELESLMEGEKERRDEEETKRKLDALEAFEREARAKKERKGLQEEKGEEFDIDAELEESLGKLSIYEEGGEGKEKEVAR